MDKQKKGDEKDMNAIAVRTGQGIKDMASILAAYPAPDKWTAEQKTQAVNFAALLDTAQKMIGAANLAGIDWQAEKAVFLDNAGKENSAHTRRGYDNALGKLETWAAPLGVNLLELSPAQADDFIYSLGKSGAAPATVRHATAASSSFYSFLHRRHPAIDNPFRGSKARPKEKPIRPLAIPTAAEVKIIIREIPPAWAAAVSLMYSLGLRCGGLPGLSVKGDRWNTHSKGKDIAGNIAPDTIERIKAAGLPLREPFKGRTTNSIEIMISYHIKKLFKSGKVKAPFSCHDFRHAAAVREYQKTRDVYHVKEFLFHSSVTVTERYLRSLNIEL
jgi:site-specific recombinase XerD